MLWKATAIHLFPCANWPVHIVQPSCHGADDSEQGWRRQRSATHERAVLLPVSLGRSLRRVMIHRKKTE